MASEFVLVKTAHPVDTPFDPLDLDSDPAFKTEDYRKVAEQICSDAVWNGEEGTGSMFGHAVALTPTDACLFMSFAALLTSVEADQLASQALALGAVVLDAESVDMLSGRFEL
ncbi:hypothetical protein JM946_02400 [Steroidobacter sp. S1-65]|uniref:Uncharacterized protein n=1 Tax=Steroidobacter gossypii TaxID=2805490 RepID=A0ABS1WRG7_9GAMM|nr:hypothetical protein [Steroidobacter gossypii]MBM0103571.1 hypothetical protein [Steroidobacter gossypii]